MDSLETVGSWIITHIALPTEFSMAIYTALLPIAGWLITMVTQESLKSLSTKWYWQAGMKSLTVNLAWKILAALFGKSILFYNATIEKTGMQK
jgi:hypothetical protein